MANVDQPPPWERLLRRVVSFPAGVAGLLRQHHWPTGYVVGIGVFVALLAVLWIAPTLTATIMTFLQSRLPAITVSVAAIVVLAVWKLPQWQIASSRRRLDRKDYIDLETQIRTTLIQAGGGILLLLGAFTSIQNLLATQEQTRQGQIADRFTHAIDQLGSADSNGKPRIEVRLGGIYALEQIANVSDDDYGQVIEILTAYVRQNAPWPEESQSTPTVPPVPTGSATPVAQVSPRADIRAVLTVLGRRRHQYRSGEKQWLDLRQTDLRGADFAGAHLEAADLRFADLEGADLSGAYLEEAGLEDAHLEKARLSEARLEVAIFNGAYLKGAVLNDAYLKGAVLDDAHLEGAYLIGAHLEGADLSGAYLQGADLRDATGLTEEKLRSAYIDQATRLPGYLAHP